MDTAALEQRAHDISQQYLISLPETPEGYARRNAKITDPTVLITLFKAISAGLNQRDSCAAAGIHSTTFSRWMAQAEQDPESAYATFAADLKAAKANGKLTHLENIARHSQKEWTASAWTLERTDPEQFALRKDTDTSPRVVVQIGVSSSRVEVNVLGAETGPLSPPLLAVEGERSQNP